MDVKIKLNGKLITDSVDQDMVLLDFCRKHNCFSVKRGCESGNCGLCTVLLDGKPVLSCSTPIGRADGRAVDTLEGLEEEAKQFTGFFAAQGADQCGFCNPGYIVNIVALLREQIKLMKTASTAPEGITTQLENVYRRKIRASFYSESRYLLMISHRVMRLS